MSTDRPRYTVSVDDELLKQIEDYQFEHRYKTRSSATVELIRLGIQQLMQEQPKIVQNTAPVPFRRRTTAYRRLPFPERAGTGIYPSDHVYGKTNA